MVSHVDHLYFVQVNDQHQVFYTLVNGSKSHRVFRVRTYLGSYEEAEIIASKVNTNVKIHNKLLPYADQLHLCGERTEKLKAILQTEYWSHRTDTQQQELVKIINKHNTTF